MVTPSIINDNFFYVLFHWQKDDFFTTEYFIFLLVLILGLIYDSNMSLNLTEVESLKAITCDGWTITYNNFIYNQFTYNDYLQWLYL